MYKGRFGIEDSVFDCSHL